VEPEIFVAHHIPGARQAAEPLHDIAANRIRVLRLQIEPEGTVQIPGQRLTGHERTGTGEDNQGLVLDVDRGEAAGDLGQDILKREHAGGATVLVHQHRQIRTVTAHDRLQCFHPSRFREDVHGAHRRVR
jgi:hypothetical protein